MNPQDLQEFLTDANTEIKNGNYEQAISMVENALVIAAEQNDLVSKARALHMKAHLYKVKSDYTLAIEYYHHSLEIYEELGSKDDIAHNLHNIGLLYFHISDFSKALEYFRNTLALYEELNDKSGIARNLGNLGNVYHFLSEYTLSLEYLQKALAIYEELNSKDGIAFIVGNIGIVYSYLHDHIRSLEYFQKAYAVFEELGIKDAMASNLANIGTTYHELKDSTKELECYLRALSINKELDRKDAMANNLLNIGSLYYTLLSYSEALEYYQKALAIYEQLGVKYGIACTLTSIGVYYADKNHDHYSFEKAEEKLLKAISISEEIGEKHNLYYSHKSIAALYKQERLWEQYSSHIEIYQSIKEEVQSDEVKQMADRAAYERQMGEIQREQDVTERILHNILPKEIASRIRRGDEKIVDSYESVSVLFADIVGFTKLTQNISPENLVAGLDNIFNTFDRIADKHGCEKIKTIGDCYMVVAGLPERCDDHAKRLALMALDMKIAISEFPALSADTPIAMRIGIHSGSVVAGIIGKNRYAYDLWGDAVNIASRMESHGEAGKIHVSEEFVKNLIQKPSNVRDIHDTIPAESWDGRFIERGDIEIKGRGLMKTYFLIS